MQQTGNAVRKITERTELEAPEMLTPEDAAAAMSRAIRESFSRIYLPSGVIFQSVKKGRWSFFFGGNYANPPKRTLQIGESWEPAAGAFRMRYAEGTRLLHFLWDFLCDQLHPKAYLDIRSEERALRVYPDQENRTVCLQYIDNGQLQSTRFYLEDHRVLDLYLGMLAGFRFMMRGKFANADAAIERGETPDFDSETLMEAYPLEKRTVNVVLKSRHMIILNAVVNNELFRITQAHAPMLSHTLTAHLYRTLRNRVTFSDYMDFDLPTYARASEQDNGRLRLGIFHADFSRVHTPFLVALHLGSTHLIDGLPMSIYR